MTYSRFGKEPFIIPHSIPDGRPTGKAFPHLPLEGSLANEDDRHKEPEDRTIPEQAYPVDHCWHRCRALLAQVQGIVGTGVEKGWGPAPLKAVEAHFAAQVPRGKPHLRQGGTKKGPTCAKEGQYLRQGGTHPQKAPPAPGRWGRLSFTGSSQPGFRSN